MKGYWLAGGRSLRRALFCLLVLAAVLLAACGAAQKSVVAPSRRPARSARVAERPDLNPPAAALGASFSVLRRPRMGDDALPPQLIPGWAGQRFGIEPARSRLVNTFAGKLFFVVPGARVLCLFGRDNLTGACWPTGAVRRGDAISSSLCSPALARGTLRLVGLVPDGVGAVRVEWQNGRDQEIEARNNSFVGDVRAGSSYPRYVSWRRGGHRVRHPVGIPSAMRPSDCGSHRQAPTFP